MPHLDREQIVTTALALLDRVGLDKLSTRALADELGVQSPALYWHFRSKQDLIDAMSEAISEEIAEPAARPEDDAVEWIVQRAQAFRRALLAHRDGARVHAGTRPSASQLPRLAGQVEALVRGGFTRTDAIRAMLAMSRYTVGWVLEEQAATASPEGWADTPSTGDGLPSILADDAVRHVLEQRDPDADFTFGISALAHGIGGLRVT